MRKAFDLYVSGVGGYKLLGAVLGDYARGLRVLSGFSTDGTPATVGLALPDHERAILMNDWGQYAMSLGDLVTAREAHKIGREYRLATSDHLNSSIVFCNTAEVELLAGRWPAARDAATTSVYHAGLSGENVERIKPYACLATALSGLGFVADSRRHFAEAKKGQSNPFLYSISGVWEAEWKLATGDQVGALTQTEANRKIAVQQNWTDTLALCDVLRGLCKLSDDLMLSGRCLASAREYASRTGHIETALRCYHLAAVLARYEKNFDLALSEALDGIQLADSCGFGRWSLDLRTELAKIHLAAGQPAKAVEPAEWVLKRSDEPDCQYGWGIADSLHLLGVAHARMRGKANRAKARDYLRRAVEKRKAIEHPGFSETEEELRKVHEA